METCVYVTEDGYKYRLVFAQDWREPVDVDVYRHLKTQFKDVKIWVFAKKG